MLSRFRIFRPAAGGCLAGLMGLFLAHPAPARFSPGQAEFAAQCNQQRLAYSIQSVFVLPDQALQVEVLEPQDRADYTLDAGNCRATALRPGAWQVLPPSRAGCYHALLANPRTGHLIRLQIFVLVPYQRLRQQRLNGYRIGAYPDGQGRSARYSRPQGFIEVTAANQSEWVSPHFQLHQFRCKQRGGFPQYIVLRPELLSKLEGLLELLATRGCNLPTLNILSGYRTPYYNQRIHNRPFSAHQWGLAADISLERPADDLNHDGRVDLQDAELLYQAVEDWEADPGHAPLVGGLGLYFPRAKRAPFVHMDVRGVQIRWGRRPPSHPRFARQEPSAIPALPAEEAPELP